MNPQLDDIGASETYLLQLTADRMGHSEAIEEIVRMYMNAGVVRQVGIEKVALSTTEVHVINALKAHGRRISVENKSLVLLQPKNRPLAKRVEGALAFPLNNGKLFYSTAINSEAIYKMKLEADKFPFYHADILNVWAYLYDMMADFTFNGTTKRVIDYRRVQML